MSNFRRTDNDELDKTRNEANKRKREKEKKRKRKRMKKAVDGKKDVLELKRLGLKRDVLYSCVSQDVRTLPAGLPPP